ncbi:hypothetical protein T492DRAFT_609742 [Pavlovales sp. CCMP2436]|nr:hypothetical protein T492DRAFT_609742 [Pavlovales sp. CCMP2436]|mmetsp:Transcript_33290/g.82949  ORF Transcript_33290/g.82949 Transcript_33290/m.82949 type:complete len:123 (+) Transcript_33290:175-543(+)
MSDVMRTRVACLDLSALHARLVRTLDFAESEVNAALIAYRQFLKLKVAFDDTDAVHLSPSLQVWHSHILDTSGYMAACQLALDITAGFLHHDADGAADQEACDKRVAATRFAFRARFGAECS